MASSPAPAPVDRAAEATPREFVAFVAALMAVNALGVDLMLPALAESATTWRSPRPITGSGSSPSTCSASAPGSWSMGRLPIATGAGRSCSSTLAGFVAASVFAASSATFAGAARRARAAGADVGLDARAGGGDRARRLSGRQMARTMSIAQMIFFLVPILAPTLGAGAARRSGRGGSSSMRSAAFAAFVLAWTLTAAARDAAGRAARADLARLAARSGYRLTLTNRYSIGYALAASMTFGGIIAFVSSAQQIFVDEFGAGDRFTLLFAICALRDGVRVVRQQPAGRAAGHAADLAGRGAGADRAVARPHRR